MNRRDFLSILSLLSTRAMIPAPLLFLSGKAHASEITDPGKEKYFVLVRLTGGWDVTLGLDPKVHANGSTQDDMFIEYAPEQISDVGGVKLAPAATRLKDFAGEFSVVNGLISASRDNGHDANVSYLSTGRGDGKAPYLPVEIAMATRSGSLGVAFGGAQMIALDRPVMVSSLDTIASFKTSLQLPVFTDSINQSPIHSDIYKAQKALIDDRERLDLLVKLLTPITYSEDPIKYQSEILAAAFLSGTSFQGQIDCNASLDTHSGHEKTHLTEQKKGWEQICTIFDTFKKIPVGTGGASLFDRTVFMVMSEFGRTPALNAAKGKDHNPLDNSVLLAGGGIQGGKVVGESHLITRAQSGIGVSLHTALPMNFATGEIARTRAQAEAQGAGFKYITPENIIMTVAQAMGSDLAKFKSVAQDTAALPGLIKTNW